MQRAFSRPRLHSDDTFNAAIAISDSESDYESIERNSRDDDYFIEPICDLSEHNHDVFNVLNYSKKRERVYSTSFKASKPMMRKSFSYSCLSSNINNDNSDVHKTPAKLSVIARSSSLTRIHSTLSLTKVAITSSTNNRTQKRTKKIGKRKSSRHSQARNIPTIISRPSSKEQENVLFSTLPDDVTTYVMSYLEKKELRSLMGTCLKFMTLCRSERLWLKFCEKEWSVMKSLKGPSDARCTYLDLHKSFQFYDEFAIPIIPSSKTNRGLSKKDSSNKLSEVKHNKFIDLDDLCPNHVNLSTLLRLTQPHPQKIDNYFFSSRSEHTSINDTITPLRENHEEVPKFRTFQMSAKTNAFPEKRDISVVQFTSVVGTGDRCIRSDVPFPPLQIMTTRKFPHLGLFAHIAKVRGKVPRKSLSASTTFPLQEMFKRGKKYLSLSHIKPFVSPNVTKVEDIEKNGRKERIYTINVSPRLIAYFEVTLIPRDEVQEPKPSLPIRQEAVSHSSSLDAFEPSLSNDCVAIGVSNHFFNTSGKMPGWDIHSYGFHGDDGGLFHAGGMMVRSYGPKFGVGDTVGCGINYSNQGIFFTLNGRFLGYGWTEIDMSDPLYPTIGIDTHTPIESNFGSSPFAYNISSFLEQQYHEIDDSLRYLPIAKTY